MKSAGVRRVTRITLVALALIGFFISLYLTLMHYRNAIPPCYVTSGCESVVTSRYATIVGVPLALVGALHFAVMFYLGIAVLVGSRTIVVRAYDLLAIAGVVAAVVLFLIQAVVLKAFCIYCLATEAVALLIWVGSLLATSLEERE